MKREADVLVIGAGILGSSVAYYLAKRGKRVIVLEKGEICSGTSSTTAALVLPSPKTPAVYNRLAWAGYERIRGLEQELGRKFELQITGSTMLCRKEEEANSMKKTIQVNGENGKELEWLSPEEIIKREPILNPKAFCGGVYCKDGGNLNPFLLVNAYIQAAKELGVQVCTFTEVQGFTSKGHQITEVHTNQGDFFGGQVICAAGNSSILFSHMLGFEAHIYNTRGLILVSEKLPPVLHSTYAEMHQSADGNILLGANFRNVEKGCNDRRTYYDELQEVCDDIGFLAPALKEIKIIRTYAGIRILPEDGLPIVGKIKEDGNFWIM